MYGVASNSEFDWQGAARSRTASGGPVPEATGIVPEARSVPVVLVAEDDTEMRALIVEALCRAGYRVKECRNGAGLLIDLKHFISPEEPWYQLDLIISDIRMPGVTGLEVLELAEISPDFPPVILITAFGDEQTHAEAARLGAVTVFDKPFDIDTLLTKVREVVPLPPSESQDNRFHAAGGHHEGGSEE